MFSGFPAGVREGSGDGAAHNRLLAALPDAESKRLLASASLVSMRPKVVVFEPNEVPDSVYFPTDCVVSLVNPLVEGTIIEVATVGNEGIVGVPFVIGGSLPMRAITQVTGHSLRVDAAVFGAAIEHPGPVQAVVRDYVQALFGQIAQAAACNRLHSSEQRLGRWLLMCGDRVGADEFSITHEFLGQMLGARRATVTLSAGALQSAGLIRYHRGHVAIRDRPGLERAACECYLAIRQMLDAVVDRAVARRDRTAGA